MDLTVNVKPCRRLSVLSSALFSCSDLQGVSSVSLWILPCGKLCSQVLSFYLHREA